MAIITPATREFSIMRAGYIRDSVVLATWRSGLRRRINPQTGNLFTEDEIARSTRPGSRWYIEAQAIDEYGQGRQRNALWLIDQIQADRASSRWLEEFHGKPLGVNPLSPTGASGSVRVRGTPTTLVFGSTTLGAPGAYTARDPAGNIYQVFVTGQIQSNGQVDVTLRAVSTGAATNLEPGTTLQWITKDAGMDPTCEVVGERFRGGTDRETNSEYLQRIVSAKRYKPAAGNDPQFREWTRSSSNAIEDGFIYPCALHAGSVVVSMTAKRVGAIGPLARIPDIGTLSTAIAYLVPPLSPVVPPRSFVLPVAPNSEPTDLVLRLALQRGSDAGWRDARPFPSYHATTPQVTQVVGPTSFRMTCPGDATLPGFSALATASGSDAPHIMAWDVATSSFVELNVASVTDEGSNVFLVTLATSATLTVGQFVSPSIPRRALIADAVGAYFDGLGPGDFFDPDTDPRGGRCVRFPEVGDEFPFRAGSVVATRVIEALGGSSADADLDSITLTEPSYPTSIIDGPNLLTLGKLGVYEI